MSELNICAKTGDALASTSLCAGMRRSSTTSVMSLKVALANQLSSPATTFMSLKGRADGSDYSEVALRGGLSNARMQPDPEKLM